MSNVNYKQGKGDRQNCSQPLGDSQTFLIICLGAPEEAGLRGELTVPMGVALHKGLTSSPGQGSHEACHDTSENAKAFLTITTR